MMNIDAVDDTRRGAGAAVAAPAEVAREECTSASGHRRLAPLTTSTCQCGRSTTDAAQDVSRRVSSHRTASGRVVYFRCECGRVAMAEVRWTTPQ